MKLLVGSVISLILYVMTDNIFICMCTNCGYKISVGPKSVDTLFRRPMHPYTLSLMSALPAYRHGRPPPRERGITYGTTCRERIRATINFYRFIFQAEGGLDWPRALNTAAGFAEPIELYDPDIMEEIRGIAQGAKVPLNEILAINTRSELLFLITSGAGSPKPCCTSLAAVPPPHQHLHPPLRTGRSRCRMADQCLDDHGPGPEDDVSDPGTAL
jgi:hypothetical protein